MKLSLVLSVGKNIFVSSIGFERHREEEGDEMMYVELPPATHGEHPIGFQAND